AGRPLSLLRIERLRGARRPLDQLGQVAQPLTFLAEGVLPARLHARRVLDQRAQLAEPGLARGGVGCELLQPSPRGLELPPRGAAPGAEPQLLLAAEGVENGQLVGRPGQAPLLELP